MSSVEKACRDYRDTLSTLVQNNKLKINLLSMLAGDYARFSKEIVDLIKESVLEVPNNQKLFRLYLMDSIVKNFQDAGDYIEHFAKCLVEIFVHVFQRGDEETRKLLFKLRNTWTDVFPRGKLYSLDLEVHQIDSKWPITVPEAPKRKPAPPVEVANTKRKRNESPRPTVERNGQPSGRPRPAPIRKQSPLPRHPAPGPAVIQPTAALGAHAFNVAPPVVPIPVNHPPPYPQPLVYGAPPMVPRYGVPPQIQNDAPRLPNAAGNNRIFVDGKAYEVLFINNIAVIERNGVPHRVFFSGHPRDVIVDGVRHQLAFGETKPIDIDGQTHFIRFGAPSRELYMGDFPFRGAFGSGPAIVATINGKRHEIRLGGPPPEVKIEQDPCYELARDLQAARQNTDSMGSRMEPPKRVEEEKDKLGDLLAKLQRTGVLDTLGAALRSTTNVESKKKNSSPADRELTPPIIPSATILVGEDREVPSSSLSGFYTPDLFVRYESVIRSLLKPRSICTDCGVMILDRDSPLYKKHVDEHVQRELGNLPAASRGPFLSEDEWVEYSYVDKVNKQPPVEVLTSLPTDEEERVEGLDAMSSEADGRICGVCREDFREYFDQETDEWRLENSVVINGKPFHRTCQSDATFDELPTTES